MSYDTNVHLSHQFYSQLGAFKEKHDFLLALEIPATSNQPNK